MIQVKVCMILKLYEDEPLLAGIRGGGDGGGGEKICVLRSTCN